MIVLDPQYAEEFESLFAEQDLAVTAGMFDYVKIFDEVPIYTRSAQLEFLSGLDFAEANRELVRAAVGLLERIEFAAVARRTGSKNLLRMVAVTGWHVFDASGLSVCNDGSMDVVKPYIFAGNLDDDRMGAFRPTGGNLPTAFRPGQSPCAEFVRSALDSSLDYLVYDSKAEDWCPDRVYVQLGY